MVFRFSAINGLRKKSLIFLALFVLGGCVIQPPTNTEVSRVRLYRTYHCASSECSVLPAFCDLEFNRYWLINDNSVVWEIHEKEYNICIGRVSP